MIPPMPQFFYELRKHLKYHNYAKILARGAEQKKTLTKKRIEKGFQSDTYQGNRRAESMSQRERKQIKKRIPRLVFQFSCFPCLNHLLRFSLWQKKLSEEKPETVFPEPALGLRTEMGADPEGKNEKKQLIPTWSWKQRGFMPYSVERAKDPSTENIVSDACWATQLKSRQEMRPI